jgi:hypothetical protein
MRRDILNHHTLKTNLIRNRRSWRSYGEQALESEKRELLSNFFNNLDTPFWGNRPRFNLVDVGSPGKGRIPGTYGMIKGAGVFLVGAVKRGHRDMEDFGYLFEQIILYATELDLATCWIGVTFARGPLADKIKLTPQETIPCVTPLGYSAKRRSISDAVTRTTLGASKRKPWKDIFFNGSWDTPLDKQTAEDYEIPLEMLRLAPSATNKQPWRIVKDKGIYHFFLQRAAGYDKMTSGAADLQRVDMGIAMCHFELTAKEQNLSGDWIETDTWPVSLPKKCEYIVTWQTN